MSLDFLRSAGIERIFCSHPLVVAFDVSVCSDCAFVTGIGGSSHSAALISIRCCTLKFVEVGFEMAVRKIAVAINVE